MSQRIFVHHSGALGDVILSLPAIEALRGPDDSISFAGRPDVVELLGKVGCIQHGYAADSRIFLSLFMETADDAAKRFFDGFDMIYVFTSDTHSKLAQSLHYLFPRGLRIIMTVPPHGLRKHVSEFRLDQIAAVRAIKYRQPLLTIPDVHKREARQLLLDRGYDFKKPLMAVHPGSGSSEKCWPMNRFKKLMQEMKLSEDRFFILLSGPAETDDLRREIENCSRGHGRDCIYLSDLELIHVAAFLSLCNSYAGNDSGITHLASAVMDGRVVAIFGPSDPFLWRPFLGDSVAVSSSTLSDISVKSVLNELMSERRIIANNHNS